MKRIFKLTHDLARAGAIRAVQEAPAGMVVTIQQETRSLEQNARLWATLADISRQVEWYGQKLSSEDWKHVFTASLTKARVVPGLDGGFVVCGLSTSKMSKATFSELLELINAFGAEHGVQWSEPALQAFEGRKAA